MKRILLLTAITMCMLFSAAVETHAQNVMSPTDTLVTYNPNSPPVDPGFGKIVKWVRTVRLSWPNNEIKDYKSYYFNGMAYRLRFPKTYNPNLNDGKKYPIILFFHGAGEVGTVYDNEFHLLHGGQYFDEKVINNEYDGYILYPQEQTVGWSDAQFININQILDTLTKYNKMDPDRLIAMGLSIGGNGTIRYISEFPQRSARGIPSSPSYVNTYNNSIPAFVHVPIWVGSGGIDTNPDSASVHAFVNFFSQAGGDIQWTLFPNLGHGIWQNQWNDPQLDSMWNYAHKANPRIFFGRNSFCPDSAITVKLGITAGFAAYEWRKNGAIIPGSNSNEITPGSYGTFDVHFKRNIDSPWSAWSLIPAVISVKTATNTPPIKTTGIRSRALPATDGSTTVPLELPTGYASYSWVRVSDNAVVSTSRTFVAPVGQYKAQVTEQFGCGALFSPVFTVVDANGSAKPDKAKNLSGYANSSTSVSLEWNTNPTPVNPTSGFEIYRAVKSGGPYQIVFITNATSTSYIDKALEAKKDYYYVVRSFNETGVGALSNEIKVSTVPDVTAPTAPTNLNIVFSSRSYIQLAWSSSTDDAGVYKYDIYINGKKSYATSDSTFTVYNLPSLQTFNIVVKARDLAGNSSTPSNQVTASSISNGLKYRYYEGFWDNLPNFDLVNPSLQGTMPNVSIAANYRNPGVSDNFGFVYEGYINIPTTGSYQFETISDDGSRLWIGSFYNFFNTPLVNNDGLHGPTTVVGTITLQKGIYPFSAAFFEAGGGEQMDVLWKTPGSSSFVAIPNSAFADSYTPPNTAPLPPSTFKASGITFNKISLSWISNSGGSESGYEIARATSAAGPYTTIVTTAPNVTSYIDSNLVPATAYYYNIRAVGAGGESSYESYLATNWKLNNDFAEANGQTLRDLTGSNTSFNSADSKEGGVSLSFNGTSSVLTVNNSGGFVFPSDSFSQRTIGFWMKPAANTNNRMLFEFGGNDNGIALRQSAGNLVAGIASNNVRLTSNAVAFTTNTWTFITIVVNGNSMLFYKDGVLQNTQALTFSSVGASNSTSQFGYPSSGTTNAFNDANTSYSFYSGLLDNIFVVNNALTQNEIATLMNNTFVQSFSTTQPAPAALAKPTALTATAVSGTQINIGFNDNEAAETGFELYRSTNDSLHYHLIKTLTAKAGTGAVTYSDAGLYQNLVYYYKVRAINAISSSPYSTYAQAKTTNTKPVLAKIKNYIVRYNTTSIIPITASDADDDGLVFTAVKPAFVNIVNVSNGVANLVISPKTSNVGSFAIKIYVADPNGGKDTAAFTLGVDNNNTPTITALNDISAVEGTPLSVPIAATDVENAAKITWTFNGLPGFVTFVPGTNGAGMLNLLPGYANAGVYSILGTATDGSGGISTKTFVITVTNKTPNTRWLVNIKNGNTAPAPWNNMNTASISSLKSTDGATTSAAVTLTTGALNPNSYGGTTGNNSGVYPDAVIIDEYDNGKNRNLDSSYFDITGLSPSRAYNFKFLSNNNYAFESAIGKTIIRIGAKRDSVISKNNFTKLMSIKNAVPDATGKITFVLFRNFAAQNAYLNGFEFTEVVNDGTLPAKATNLAASFTAGNGATLTWKDVAYNENNYYIFRSIAKAGPYTLLNPQGDNSDDTMYVDKNGVANITYYYYVGANNSIGTVSSDTVSVAYGNNAPKISAINDLYVKADNSITANFTVTDDPGDSVNVSITNLPSFASLVNLGGGSFRFTANTTRENTGFYNFVINAKDTAGLLTTRTFRLNVSDKYTRTVLVNFGSDLYAMSSPWNNFSVFPDVNTSLSNLVDDSKAATPFGFTLLDGWNERYVGGFTTGNNSGIVPDSVLMSGIYTVDYTGNPQPKRIKLTGLNPLKRYTLGFVSSINGGYDLTSTYKVGTDSVTFSGTFVSNAAPHVAGIKPNALGEIIASIGKSNTASYSMLNALIIQEYDSTAVKFLSPTDLRAEAKTRKAVQLTWSDRAFNELNYEVYRATSAGGTYTLIATIAGNSTTYNDNTVVDNTMYFYQVRAKNGTNFSDYSNVTSTVTPAGITSINLSDNNNGPAPWNNTNKVPAPGDVFKNFTNDSLYNTGYNLTIVSNFNGVFDNGRTTGNNSGVAPDAVLQTNYAVGPQGVAVIKFSGLDVSKKYRIGFAGSTANYPYPFDQGAVTTFTIGDRTVNLNAIFNVSKMVFIGDITPSSEGEVTAQISTSSDALFGYLGSIVIQGYTDAAGGAVVNALNPNGPAPILISTAPTELAAINSALVFSAFPNPFTDNLNIFVNSKDAIGTMQAEIFDLNGKLLFKKQYNNLAAGANTLQINNNQARLAPGMYMLRLNINGKTEQSLKLLKAVK